MSDPAAYEPEVVDQEVVDAPEGDAAAGAPQTPPEATEGERVYAGKYKSVDELERAYTEAQRLISQTRPAEAQPQADPLSFLPPQIDEATFKRIEASAERDPQGTAMWALQNQQYLGQQITGAILRNWQDQDFLGFQQWQMQQLLSTQQQAAQEQWRPIEAHTYQQISNSAVAEAGRGIPDFEEYKPKILAAIEQNAYLAEHVAGVANNPQQLAASIRQVYGMVKGNEYVQQLSQQPANGQPASAVDSAKQKARTETRSTATPEEMTREKALQQMILNAKP